MKRRLSIIIPVYNEKKTIMKVVDKVKKVKLNSVEKEIIIVDDCSNDGTRSILEGLENDLQVFYHAKNNGKGAAIRTGLREASGDMVVFQDADLEYNPDDFKKLMKPILSGKSKVVYGSRFCSKNSKFLFFQYLGNRIITLLTNILYNTKLSDVETCYKMFSSDVVKSIRLRSSGFELEVELTAKTLKKGIRIIEMPISYYKRNFHEGKKLTWVDGLKALWYTLKYRFFD